MELDLYIYGVLITLSIVNDDKEDIPEVHNIKETVIEDEYVLSEKEEEEASNG